MSTELILRSFLKLEIICAALSVVTPSPPSPKSLESHCTSSSGPGSVVGGWNMIQFRSLYFPLTLGRQLPALTTKQFITASFLQTMFHASHSAHLVAVVGSIRSVLWQYPHYPPSTEQGTLQQGAAATLLTIWNTWKYARPAPAAAKSAIVNSYSNRTCIHL